MVAPVSESSVLMHTHRFAEWKNGMHMQWRVSVYAFSSRLSPNPTMKCGYCKNALSNINFTSLPHEYDSVAIIIIIVVVVVDVVPSAKLFDSKSLLMLMHINTVAEAKRIHVLHVSKRDGPSSIARSTYTHTTVDPLDAQKMDWKLQQQNWCTRSKTTS